MRLSKPRILPITEAEATPEQRELLAPFAETMGILNIFRTLVRTPRAFKRFNVWGTYVLGRGTSLAPRERELVILRAGWRCRSGYEWVQHRRIGLDAGVTEAEIERVKAGPAAEGWTPVEAALLQAVDELVGDFFISGATWAALASLSEAQRMDLVYTVGQYAMVSMMLNTFGVQLDEGQTLDRDFPR